MENGLNEIGCFGQERVQCIGKNFFEILFKWPHLEMLSKI